VVNRDEAALSLTVSIRDHEHFRRGGAYHDRFNGRYLIAPGWNDLRIPIAEIRAAPAERALDLADLSELVLFTVDLAHPRRLYLDRARLSRGAKYGTKI
jgi:hypothetical protein